MMTDQAAKLRQLVKTGKSRARVVAITSGKGGVGKTNISIGLAIEAAKLGKKVVLMDMDLGLANVDVILNVRGKYNLAHVILGKKDITEVILPAPGGFSIIPGASGLGKLADLDENLRKKLINKFEKLEQRADLILIDTGAGISSNTTKFALCADEVIILSTPEPTSITDAYAMIKVLASFEEAGDLKVLINMAENREDAARIAESLVKNSHRFLNVYVEKLGYVLKDPWVPNAVLQRKPFTLAYPECAASRCMANLARRLFDLTPAPFEEKEKSGFFAKLFHMFRAG